MARIEKQPKRAFTSLSKVNWDEDELVLIPVHVFCGPSVTPEQLKAKVKNHWLLLACFLQIREIHIYDSLTAERQNMENLTKINDIFKKKKREN